MNMNVTQTPSMQRQIWLERAGLALRKRFEQLDHKVPGEVRFSIGWPKGSHGGKRAIGQCWATAASSDHHAEIFISPELGHKGQATIGESVRVMGVLAHEIAHAIAGQEAGHRRPFQAVAAAIGLEAPWTATTESPEFTTWARGVVKDIGTFPAGALSLAERKKEGTRLLKCECAACGYVARVTRKWVEIAPPICPTDRVGMICEQVDDEDEEG